MKTEKKIEGFRFAEIPLDEAVNAVIAGDGNYAEIKAKLLEVLPNLPDDKAFAFGFPNGKEVEERQRRGICMAVNMTLKKAQLSWRVTYSGTRKLFVCVPKDTPRTYAKTPKVVPTSTPQSKPKARFPLISTEIKEQARSLREQGLSAHQIAKKLGIKNSTAEYLCYTQLKKQ